MLESKNSSGHQYGSLLPIQAGFEGGPYSNFGLPETYIATHQAVHRRRRLHIFLHIRRSLALVGSVLVNKRSLQLGLHVVIRGVLETLLGLTLGIQLYEVESNFFNLGL